MPVGATIGRPQGKRMTAFAHSVNIRFFCRG